jgi:hypothetical protein
VERSQKLFVTYAIPQGDIKELENIARTDISAPLETEVDRPKSPWTPSYSVMRQGSIKADLPTQDDITLPPPVINEPEIDSYSSSYSVLTQGPGEVIGLESPALEPPSPLMTSDYETSDGPIDVLSSEIQVQVLLDEVVSAIGIDQQEVCLSISRFLSFASPDTFGRLG